MAHSFQDEWMETSLRWNSHIVVFLCMLAIQYVFLKTYRLRKVLPPEALPTNIEVWTGVAAFWICHSIFEASGMVVLRYFMGVIFDGLVSSEEINSISKAKAKTVVRGLVDRMAMTAILHHSVLVLLDTIIPFARNPRRDPSRELTSILSRTSYLLVFVQNLILGSSKITPHAPLKILTQNTTSRSTTQTVPLQRVQTDHPNEGQRILAWNLVIDKEALDEMKETLGPPGGFGELGFSVGGDGIRFEAMGVGTSFVLDFEVSATKQRRCVTLRQKTK